MSAVKQFLVGYFEDRKQEGYIVLQDPLWEFYEALSVGYGGGENMEIDTFFQQPPTTHSGFSSQLRPLEKLYTCICIQIKVITPCITNIQVQVQVQGITMKMKGLKKLIIIVKAVRRSPFQLRGKERGS